MTKQGISFVLFVLIAWPILSHASGVTKWVDENGKTHYGERAPEQAEQLEMNDNLSVTSGGDATQASVVLYSTRWCGYCKHARRYMNARGIAFSEFDIEQDRLAKRRFEQAGKGTGVPFLVRGEQTLRGYSQASYDRFFAAK